MEAFLKRYSRHIGNIGSGCKMEDQIVMADEQIETAIGLRDRERALDRCYDGKSLFFQSWPPPFCVAKVTGEKRKRFMTLFDARQRQVGNLHLRNRAIVEKVWGVGKIKSGFRKLNVSQTPWFSRASLQSQNAFSCWMFHLKLWGETFPDARVIPS